MEAITLGGILVLAVSFYWWFKEENSFFQKTARFLKRVTGSMKARNQWRKPRNSERVITGDGRVYTTNIK